MKTYKILPLIAFSVLSLFTFQGVKADVFYEEYYDNQQVQEFLEQGTMDFFEQIPPELRSMALSDLLNRVDGDDGDREAVQIVDRKEIFQKYYDTASNAEKQKIYINAFSLAVENRDPKMAAELFAQGAGTDPRLAQSYICHAITTSAEEKDYGFNEKKYATGLPQTKAIVPLIAKTPGLANQLCEINRHGKISQLPISQLIAMVSTDLYAQLYQQSRDADTASQAVTREYASCTVAQVRQQMFESMRPLKEARVGNSVYIVVQEGKCAINGLIKKTKIGFEFAPSNGIAGYMKKTFVFQSLDQIVVYLKGNPQVYTVLPKTAPVQPPTLRPHLSDLQPAATGVGAKKSESFAENMLASPFTKNVSDTIKGFFGGK